MQNIWHIILNFIVLNSRLERAAEVLNDLPYFDFVSIHLDVSFSEEVVVDSRGDNMGQILAVEFVQYLFERMPKHLEAKQRCEF